jgi:hypothetical protein
MNPASLANLRAGAGAWSPGDSVAVATRLDQARQLVAAARTVVERSRVLRAYLTSSSDDELRFDRNGVKTAILALPCSSRAGRGLATSCVVLDEFGHFITDSEGPATAERVWAATLPGAAQFGVLGRALVLSTPLGDANLFARLHDRAARGEIERGVAFTATTLEANPTIDAAWINAQRVVLSAAEFRAEFEASFTASGRCASASATRPACGAMP